MSREYRSIPADKVLARFSPERQARINARALELLAEEIGLGDLRKVKGITQEQVAKRIGSRQVQISRLEKRSDIKMSTLEKYLAALGAKIEVFAFFPDSGPFRLARLGTMRSSAGAHRGTPIKKARRGGKAAKRTA